MKKMLLALAMLLGIASAQAQRASEASVWNEDNGINHSGLFVNPYLGAMTGDVDTMFGFGVELGYRYHFGSGFNWDILTVGWNSGIKDGGDDVERMSAVRIMTGARYNSAPVLAGKSLYGNFNLGYSVSTNESYMNGFTYSVGAGVNLSRLVSLGISWDGTTRDSFNWGIVGLKLGLNF